MTDVLNDLGLPPLPEALPRPVLDSHTHLDETAAKSGLQPADAVALAVQVNVVGMVQVGCDADDSRWAALVAEEFDEVVASVALHPNEVARHPERMTAGLEVIAELARRERVRGVGETGLDYFRTTEPAAQRVQKESFAAHIGIAKDTGKTLVIHDRDAHSDIADVLDAEGWPERVVFHCFSGDADFAGRCLDHGAWLSFPGTVTYHANVALREALAITPRERLLVETDAPYLTPVPHRGKNNASYLVPHTARFLAAHRGDDLAELCDALRTSCEAAFGGPWLA